MTTGNKGEWSELYALIKLLSIGKLYAADEHIRPIPDMYFPILNIFRNKECDNIDLRYKISVPLVEVYVNNNKIESLSMSNLIKDADYLYHSINAKKSKKASFSIDRGDEIMNKLHCCKLKAPSNDKTDITMQLHDVQTGYSPICGFSIKSELGSPPTLLNASRATNFKYKINGLSNAQANKINTISGDKKIINRINAIYANGGELEFYQLENKTFANNLMLIDSRMEEMLSYFIWLSYKTNEKDCLNLVNNLERINPLHYPRQGFYEYKFKKLFCAIALGMMPATVWNGQDNATGGYIIVTFDGKVLAYHIYNRDFFETYLLENTVLERASTSRHDFATIYSDNEQLYINLNLQIRFK